MQIPQFVRQLDKLCENQKQLINLSDFNTLLYKPLTFICKTAIMILQQSNNKCKGEQIMFELDDLNNLVIFDSFLKTNSVINRSYHNVVAFISGGADSDRVVEILSHLDLNKRIRYVFSSLSFKLQVTNKGRPIMSPLLFCKTTCYQGFVTCSNSEVQKYKLIGNILCFTVILLC